MYFKHMVWEASVLQSIQKPYIKYILQPIH